MPTTFHVAVSGSDTGDGSQARPLRSINQAAATAQAGDTVLVHEGEYREWVRPRHSGLSDQRRITYQAAPGEHVVIKGSERVTGWEPTEGHVWKATLPNTLFGSFNPFAEKIAGDWLVTGSDGAPVPHLGEVYLNGTSFYEVYSPADVSSPIGHTDVLDHWTGTLDHVRNPEQTRYVWYAEVTTDTTTVWANFQGADPNTELVEINVRRSVFYPEAHHLDYITVRGFEMAHAASPWAPPTADQPGLIGPNWAKGWIIEDNIIHDAKCSAISLGKEASTGHNYSTQRGDKPGYQYQLESVFAAHQIGWDREHVGSHIVRSNTIYDCGQNAIVGHLGCVFSTIEDNHIYNIALKREYYGYEIAGIKLHAAIDVTIRHNRIHDCSLGTWLDWQTQGTRITRNIFYSNNRDLFVEVSHGPYLADHNIFASPASLELFSQGGALVNNLVAGTLQLEPVMDRATPYHRPHSTQVAGYAVIYGGDDRFVGNLFIGSQRPAYGPKAEKTNPAVCGTSGYNGHPASFEEYLQRLEQQPPGDHERFLTVKQPLYARHNTYLAGASAFAGETSPLVAGHATITIDDTGTEVFLDLDLPEEFEHSHAPLTEGRDLERVRFTDADFEEPDGTPARIDTDLIGAVKTSPGRYPAGPLTRLNPGHSRVRIW
ncbi:right-handed parallel beta-helix repeat-containing protein [Kineosporia babensis]|uniref:Right-handed parallel beta-helix repeat-containing protein n=1 Tax=Kineosporia babensis TaxID=499548 RepID=A0A9X1NLI7_9ACTN|nr:right-handed parallel beta-helix repeat-containing protein [Kineosporia babensis]MCD5317177.1 right-handed parallel beta-helix repeat-containing protein [Kineosporia babensis]